MGPKFCTLVVTDKCMSRCKMCFMWRNSAAAPDCGMPSVPDWKRLIFSLRRCIDGEFRLNFAGGEVLMENMTLDLIEYASCLGVNTLLNTNAYLIDEEMAKKISKSGLKHVDISLDSLDENTHDFLRGTKGAYKKVMNAIKYLSLYSEELQIRINTVITGVNISGAVDLAQWVMRDKRLYAINFQAVTQPFNTLLDQSWYLNPEYSCLWFNDISKIDEVMDELIRLKKENYYKIDNSISKFNAFKHYFRNPQLMVNDSGCHMYEYEHAVNVKWNGDIHICFDMPAIGNIKDENLDIEKLWNSPRAESVKNEMKVCKRNCIWMINCNYEG